MTSLDKITAAAKAMIDGADEGLNTPQHDIDFAEAVLEMAKALDKIGAYDSHLSELHSLLQAGRETLASVAAKLSGEK